MTDDTKIGFEFTEPDLPASPPEPDDIDDAPPVPLKDVPPSVIRRRLRGVHLDGARHKPHLLYSEPTGGLSRWWWVDGDGSKRGASVWQMERARETLVIVEAGTVGGVTRWDEPLPGRMLRAVVALWAEHDWSDAEYGMVCTAENCGALALPDGDGWRLDAPKKGGCE